MRKFFAVPVCALMAILLISCDSPAYVEECLYFDEELHLQEVPALSVEITQNWFTAYGALVFFGLLPLFVLLLIFFGAKWVRADVSDNKLSDNKLSDRFILSDRSIGFVMCVAFFCIAAFMVALLVAILSTYSPYAGVSSLSFRALPDDGYKLSWRTPANKVNKSEKRLRTTKCFCVIRSRIVSHSRCSTSILAAFTFQAMSGQTIMVLQ